MGAIATQVPQLTDTDVLETLKELTEYGFGRLEVVVRENGISSVSWTKSKVSKGSHMGGENQHRA